MLPFRSSSGDSTVAAELQSLGGDLAWEEKRRCLTGGFDGHDLVDALHASSLLMEVSGGEADLKRDSNICTLTPFCVGQRIGQGKCAQGFATAVRESGKKSWGLQKLHGGLRPQILQ